MSNPPSLHSEQVHLPPFRDLFRGWDTPKISNVILPPIQTRPVRERQQECEPTEGDSPSSGADDAPNIGRWPSQLPPQNGPTIPFPDSEDEEEETQGGREDEDSGKSGDDDEEVAQRLPPTKESQSTSQSNLLTVSDPRPILRLSPKALAEGGAELEAQQYTLQHQYRLPSSSSTDGSTSAPPAFVYQTPTAPQPSNGPVPFSFNVLRAQQGDLVNVRTPSVRAQGILRPTAIIEDEDESHKRYKCHWPNCGKKYDRPSSLEVHKYTHTGKQPFPCPENGCIRAFSVKSNMLRHFRSHPNRAGMSAAKVSAASAEKADNIAAAAKEDSDAYNTSVEQVKKTKGKGTEANKEKATDKAAHHISTSIPIRNPKPPILTITPAPSLLYPTMCARTPLTAELSAVASSDVTLRETASKDLPTLIVSVSPSISPSPSPLLSPHSPQSTYSSAPTSASADLLSPSFASTSASGSVAFSPPSSELLSPSTPHSMQSPHSPTISTASEEGESEKGQEKDGHFPVRSPPPTLSEPDQGRSVFIPVTVSDTTPDDATPSISTTCSPPPQHLTSITSTARFPSPFSPQVGSRTLYPVSETRSSLEGHWPPAETPDSDFHMQLVEQLRLPLRSSLSRSAYHRSSSPPIKETSSSRPLKHTDKRKRDSCINDDSDDGTKQDSSPNNRTIGSHGDSQPNLNVVQKKATNFTPKSTRDLHQVLDSNLLTESSTSTKSSNKDSRSSISKSARSFHTMLVDTMASESLRTTGPLRSASPRGTSVGEMSSARLSETDSCSPRHIDKRRRTERESGDYRTADNGSLVGPKTLSTEKGLWPSAPKLSGDFHERLIAVQLESSTRDDQVADNHSDLVEATTTSSAAKEKSVDLGIWPHAPKPSEDFHMRLVAMRSELSTVSKPKSPLNSKGDSMSRVLQSQEEEGMGNDTSGDEMEPEKALEEGLQIVRSVDKEISDFKRMTEVSSSSSLIGSRKSPSLRSFKADNRLALTPDTSEEQSQGIRGYFPLKPSPSTKAFHNNDDSDNEESQQDSGKGYWPKNLPSQSKVFHGLGDEDTNDLDEEEDPGGREGRDEMDIENLKNKNNTPWFRGLKPGFAQEIGKLK